jgi:hypothetical protein
MSRSWFASVYLSTGARLSKEIPLPENLVDLDHLLAVLEMSMQELIFPNPKATCLTPLLAASSSHLMTIDLMSTRPQIYFLVSKNKAFSFSPLMYLGLPWFHSILWLKLLAT